MTKPDADLGLELLYANSEKDVEEIIQGDSDMNNPDNWHALDGRETNNNVVGNQSNNGGKAATELITNMVDAILTKRCLEKGIDPKSKDAPGTMYEAVDKFICQLNGGKIINGDDGWLRKYSEQNLVIGVVGASHSPCFVFCDNGEGQSPNDFPDTFLSLSAKRKSEISFVQGKYNMGSSGVLNFCGERQFKLIISRRYDKKTPWGWTLIRKNKPKSGMPFAEYFCHGGIRTIEKEGIFPFKLQTDKKEMYNRFSLETGTIVKLYDYYIGKQGTGFHAVREVFNENLVETILPFRILDFRQKPDKSRGSDRALGIDARPLYGMEFLLMRRHADDLPDGAERETQQSDRLSIGIYKYSDLGEITIIAAVLKKRDKKGGWIKTNDRVFHHVNGQVQFKQSRGFLTQCNLPSLKDRVVLFVDASLLTDDAHQSIWKGDRQHIVENKQGEKYKMAVKNAILESTELKELNHRIAMEELDSVARDSSQELVKNMIAEDVNLAKLLNNESPGVFTPLPSDPPALRGDLKYNPTYVVLKKVAIEINLPLNKSRVIQCTTNAQNDFFTRSQYRGSLTFSDDNVADKFDYSFKLDNGNLNLSMHPHEKSVITGDEFRFQIILYNELMEREVQTEELCIKIIPKVAPSADNKKPKSPKSTSSVGLPPYRLLTRDGREIEGVDTMKWSDSDISECDAEEGGYVSDLEEGKTMYFINYDNRWFQSYLRAQKGEHLQSKIAQKYILSMRILMLGQEHAISGKMDDGKEDKDKYRQFAAKGMAAVALTVCDQLPKKFNLSEDDDE